MLKECVSHSFTRAPCNVVLLLKREPDQLVQSGSGVRNRLHRHQGRFFFFLSLISNIQNIDLGSFYF